MSRTLRKVRCDRSGFRPPAVQVGCKLFPRSSAAVWASHLYCTATSVLDYLWPTTRSDRQRVETLRASMSRYASSHCACRGLGVRPPRAERRGKTTTIRMILNIIAPDTGSIRILGRPASDRSLNRSHVAISLKSEPLRKMQVRRVLRFLAELKGMKRDAADRRSMNGSSGSTEEGRKRLGLSKSTSCRAECSRRSSSSAPAARPRPGDSGQPFSGLDPINAQALKDTMLELRQRGKTIIFSTHLMG